MKQPIAKLILAAFAASLLASAPTQADTLAERFQNPPQEAKARNWWHWPNNYATKEGITKDLEWMAENQMGGVTAFSLRRNQVFKQGNWNKTLPYGSDEWVEMMRHAAAEAKRLGLVVGMNACDGWATMGGPWIEPENSMKQLTYASVRVRGGERFEGTLPTPVHLLDFYRDVALYAYPATRPAELAMHARQIRTEWKGDRTIQSAENLFDRNTLTETRLMMPRNGQVGPLEIHFDQPIELSKIVLHPLYPGIQNSFGLGQAKLESAMPDGSWSKLTDIPLDEYASSASFGPQTVQTLRLTAKHNPPKNWIRWLPLAEIELLAPGEVSVLAPFLNDLEAKSGAALRMRGYADPEPVAADQITSKAQLIDLSGHMSEDGTLNWQAPAGEEWVILRIGLTTTGKENGPATDAGRGLEVDKLDRRGVQAHWDLFLEPFLDRMEPYTGDSFTHLLIDSWEAGLQNWSESFPEEFKKRRGYDLRPFLPIIAGEVIESVGASEQALTDWRATIAELIAENFFLAFTELAESRGIQVEAEAAGSQGYMSDPIANSGAVTVPMSEFWVQRNPGEPHDYRVKRGQIETAAAARLYGKPIVAAEAFTSGKGNWIHDPAMLKPHADAAFTMGMNQFYHHTSMHQPDDRKPGWSMNPWGININRNVTWADQAGAWATYLARCQALLQGYETVSEALLLIYPDYPAYHELEKFNRPLDELPLPGYTPTAINVDTLAKLKVRDGKLIAPSGQAFLMLDGGGHGNRSAEVDQQLKRLRGNGARVGNAEQNLKRLNIAKDFDYIVKGGGKAEIRFIHKTDGTDHWYFLSNQENRALELSARFRATGQSVELWHPVNGDKERLTTTRVSGGRTLIDLELAPYGSVFVMFRQAPTRNIPKRPQLEKLGSEEMTQPWTLKIGGHTHVLATLSSWTQLPKSQGRFFSGTATYTTEFVLPDTIGAGRTVKIDLGEVANIAEIQVNGQDLGTVWTRPFAVDITEAAQAGTNRLTVQVTNLWPNRLIGDARLPADQRTTWTNNDGHWNAKSKPLPSGMLGPVRLIVYDVPKN